MGTLCVIDVSAVVHTGANAPRYADRTSFNYPTGGINFLMSQLMVPFYEVNDIILCFDSPNFRTKLLDGYKKGRSRNSAAISQIEVLYEYLSQCGFSCCKCNGYEADDIVEWAVAEYWQDYEKVIIVGNDMDLCHSIRPNVIFRACRSDMNLIKRSSFPNAIKKGAYIPYNMISAYKCLCGCQSDHVPVFRRDNGVSGKELYANCVFIYEKHDLIDDWNKSANPNVLRVWAKQVQGFSDSEMERFNERISIIFPADRPDNFEIPVSNRFTVDFEKLSRMLTMFNVSDALHGGEMWRVQLSEEDKKEMYDLAERYRSGAFNADKNLPLSTKNRITSEPLTLDMFEKDF